jgi:hypothetical protein
MQDYDRIRDRETNRYLDRLFAEPEPTPEDRADARRDDQVQELRPEIRKAAADHMQRVQDTD